MNNVTAAIGLAQLGVIQPVLDRHIENGRFYDRALANVPGLAESAGTMRTANTGPLDVHGSGGSSRRSGEASYRGRSGMLAGSSPQR